MSAKVTLNCLHLETMEPNERLHLTARWTLIDDDPVERWGFMFAVDGRELSADKGLYETAWEAAFYMSEDEARTLAAFLTLALAHKAAAR